MEKVPVDGPALVGLKTNVTVQDETAESELPQVLLVAKSLVWSREPPERLIGDVPAFVRMEVCAVLLTPTCELPKACVAGSSVRPPVFEAICG